MIEPPFNKTSIPLASCVLTRSLSIADAELLSVAFALSEPWLTLGVSATGLKNYFLRDDTHLYRYAVRVDGQLAGVICLRYPWLRGAYIELLGLLDSYRGHGIGTDILRWAMTEAQQYDNNLWLLTSSFNQQALQFYQRQGFQQIGIVEGLVHPEYDEILLRKRLG
jgi:ribosomal protein S18 acetylase RimI-like enzyme